VKFLVTVSLLAISSCFTPFRGDGNPTKQVELKNFHRIAPLIWRSSGPTTKEQWLLVRDEMRLVNLEKPAVVQLCLPDECPGDFLAPELGFDVYQFGIRPSTETEDPIEDILDEPDGTTMLLIEDFLATRCSKSPCLIHCFHGCDRTGLVSAMADVIANGTQKGEAWRRAGQICGQYRQPFFVGLTKFWNRWTPTLR